MGAHDALPVGGDEGAKAVAPGEIEAQPAGHKYGHYVRSRPKIKRTWEVFENKESVTGELKKRTWELTEIKAGYYIP